LYVFLSESEHFTDFNDPKTLVWSKEDLVYGDWYGGPEKDGSYSTSITFPTSQVDIFKLNSFLGNIILSFTYKYLNFSNNITSLTLRI